MPEVELCRKSKEAINMNASISLENENIMDMNISRWSDIDWPTAYAHVNRLQARIAKAQKNGKKNLVKRLQHLLVNSFYAKCVAVRKVTTNKGKRTPGVDKVLWETPKQKLDAVRDLNPIGYRAKPLRRKFIPKKNGKMRPLSIPTMKDRAMQALYALALDPVSETTADLHSYGFRKYRGPRDAARRLYADLYQTDAGQWVVEGDIRGCFDHISHEWLMKNIPMDKRILKQFLDAGYVLDKKLFPTNEGTPQGGVISPILANMTLDGIEDMLDREYRNKWIKIGRSSSKNPHKVHLVRFADDFVITCDSKETASDIIEKMIEFLDERGLELSKEKTLITNVYDGFDFLGYNLRKRQDGKLWITPSEQSVESVKKHLKDITKKLAAATQDKLIDALNPVIRGWGMYYRNFVAKETYYDIDHYLWIILWSWARRRHDDKSSKWIHSRYWTHPSTRWEFKGEELTLEHMSDIKIIRHTLIKADANPYLDGPYFEHRYGRDTHE